MRKKKVSTTSATRQDNNGYPPGECAPYPFEANPFARSKPALPLAITYRTEDAAMAPATCATT